MTGSGDNIRKSPLKPEFEAPSPIRAQQIQADSGWFEQEARSLTPNTSRRVQARRPSYSFIQSTREAHYNLDFPESTEEVHQVQLDANSRFYARRRPRTLDLPTLLPYETELPAEQAKFLSHIVSHLYIAIKSLDLQGALSISAKDLAKLKDLSGFSDLDIALETNLFEADSSNEADFGQEDDANNNFMDDDLADSDSDIDDSDEEAEDQQEIEDERNRNDSAVQHKKSPKSAAVVGVRIWTNELLVWLKMKYDMPVTLRIALVRVYYAICLSRGQEINLKVYFKAFELLAKDIPFLYDQGLRLDYHDMLSELLSHFGLPDSSLEVLEKKEHKALLALAESASNFFDPSALPEIYTQLGQHTAISNTALVVCSMSLLPIVFSKDGPESPYDIRHYIPSFFYIWDKFHKSHDLDSHLTSRLGTFAIEAMLNLGKNGNSSNVKLEKFGIFSQSQLKILMNTLLNSLSIMKEKYSSNDSKFFHGYASTLVYSINGEYGLDEDGVLSQIGTLFNAIESYVHPTNSGEWTNSISKLVFSLVYQFHKRFIQERQTDGQLYKMPERHKLSDAMVNKFVSIVIPIVRTGIQSKKALSMETYATTIPLLAFMNSELTLEYFLLDIYDSLEGVISTHRVSAALRSLDGMIRYFAETKVFRVHITRLLLLVLPGIDSNDLEKTILAMNVFERVANFVPIYDLTNGDGDANLAVQFTQDHLDFLERKHHYNTEELEEMTIDPEIEVEALKSSTVMFKTLMKTFAERVFTLLENIPDPAKSGNLEQVLAESLPKYISIIVEALSDDIFNSFRDLFFDFVFDNTIHTIADVAAEICGALIKHDPKSFPRYFDLLASKIKEDIEENGSGQSRTGVDIVPRDQPLFWNIVILNECIGNAHRFVLHRRKELKDLIYLLFENVKGPIVFTASYIINQTLQAVTKIKMTESRLLAPAYVRKFGVSPECWGGFQFSDQRFNEENLTFEWFLPGKDEVEFAVEFFTALSSEILKRTSTSMKSYDSTDSSKAILMADDLRNNFMYLSYCISGIAFLFDPSFEEDIPKLNQHQNETIQHRLLLLKQLREMKNSKSESNDELRLENLHENLERLVDHLGSGFDSKERLPSHSEERLPSAENDSPAFEPAIPEIEAIKQAYGLDNSRSQESRNATPSPTRQEHSSRASPGVEGISVSQLNPAITFRERRLYTSRYYFGDDIEQRRSDELYLKIHKSRHVIGRSLHIICKFLTANFSDNTKLFKSFLYVISMWFNDVGRERILDHSHSKIDYDYISETQGIKRLHKPFTRIALGSRIEKYHALRVALHATSRTMTELDKILLEDLVKLSVSSYAAVAKPAQGTLVDVMKRLIGSYNVIVKSAFRYLSKALDESNEKTIESALNLFNLKRIKNKIQNDFFNLQKYVSLLYRCFSVDNSQINSLTQSLFRGISNNIAPPSQFCIIDHEAIDAIRPPDAFIDLEIKAVKLAKSKKMEVYVEKLKKLEDSVISNEETTAHWMISSLNISLILSLELNIEFPTVNNKIFNILSKKSLSDHPVIARLVHHGIARLITKFCTQELYDFEVINMFDLTFLPKNLKTVSTITADAHSYCDLWKQELCKTEDVGYYIDNKANVGFTFWGEKMKVVDSSFHPELNLPDYEKDNLRSFGSLINRSWFLEVAKFWVTENEANYAYQGTDVFFTTAIITLIFTGYVENFTFDDLLSIVEEIYEPSDKSSHIITCEILAGILMSSNVLTPEAVEKRDAFFERFFGHILNNDLSPDNSGVWTIFNWWVPSHVDNRRYPKVMNLITKFRPDQDSDSAIKEATRLGFIKTFIASITWQFSKADEILDLCIKNIDHRYQAVREQIGSILGILTFVYYPDSLKDTETFIRVSNGNSEKATTKMCAVVPHIFNMIEEWRLEVVNLEPQEILKSSYIYAASTVLTWLKQALAGSASREFASHAVNHIVPFILKLIHMKEVCQLGGIDPVTVLKAVSQIPYDTKNLNDVVNMLVEYSKTDFNSLQTIVISEFTETILFKNLFKLSKQQRERIIELTHDLLFHKSVAVREQEASTLSGLIHISPPNEVEDLIKKYSRIYKSKIAAIRRKHRKTGFKNMQPEDTIILHGATLGIGAFIHAFALMSPPPRWVPDLLATLANQVSGIPGVAGKTAKQALSSFKKTRQDTWHIDSKIFNESQMQDLEGVLLKSYFI